MKTKRMEIFGASFDIVLLIVDLLLLRYTKSPKTDANFEIYEASAMVFKEMRLSNIDAYSYLAN